MLPQEVYGIKVGAYQLIRYVCGMYLAWALPCRGSRLRGLISTCTALSFTTGMESLNGWKEYEGEPGEA